ncbi:MAG: serine hydrolase [Gammaproteobacteria bacterium]|nr:serine hydrolase [Gammaproteobacteria bacterium]MCB1851141.1 serine hydrolase [Gammaproteobacteria bacterium]MCP5416797.1 serine hydrolase [Chromatiaceae bacterium]
MQAEQAPRLTQLSAQQHSHSKTNKLWRQLNPKKLQLQSSAALVVDRFGNELYSKKADEMRPIASITKLMTAMVILDSPLPLRQELVITEQDRDLLRLTGSRLQPGATLTREELLRLALMSSENRAASALARTFPAGRERFIYAMNKKARALGMHHTKFTDPTGLDAGNRSTPRDLSRLVRAAMNYPLIRAATTTRTAQVDPYLKRGQLRFGNTNRLLGSKNWDIVLSKTGYINEAGRCLVMQAEVSGQELTIILLNSFGKLTPYGDSNRIRQWIEEGMAVSRT